MKKNNSYNNSRRNGDYIEMGSKSDKIVLVG
jgi:hypothetical protein